MTTRVLITGIAGFIGSHVVEKFSKRKFDIFGLDDYSSGKLDNLIESQHKIQEVGEGTIVDPMVCFQAFDKYKPEIVIHLAAQPSLLRSVKNPEYDAIVNNVGTINIIRACKAADVKRLVFISTSAVTSEQIVREDYAHNMLPPTNPYGMSKRHAEQYIQMLMKEAVILRLGNVYGIRQVPLGENQLVPRIIRHLMFGDDFKIYGTGENSRDFIYVTDVAQAIYEAATSRIDYAPNPINIGTGKNHTVMEVAETLFKLFDREPVFEYEDSRDDRKHVKMVVEKAKTRYKWRPKVSLEDGLKKTANWWKNENNRIS